MIKKLLYVAGPYSGDTIGNTARAEEVSIGLISKGFHVFTPHKNTSGYEQYEDEYGIGYETWITMGLDMLSRCDAMYVMNGSERSVGVQKELMFARAKWMPIFHEGIYPYKEFTLKKYAFIMKKL